MNSPALPPTTWTTGTTESIRTGTWRAALPAYAKAPSPCHLACPVGGDIARWMQQARMGDWQGAWQTLSENNPFPAVAGHVCHHPCESACNRAGYDGALAICALERHIGERALDEGWRYPQAAQGARQRIFIGNGHGVQPCRHFLCAAWLCVMGAQPRQQFAIAAEQVLHITTAMQRALQNGVKISRNGGIHRRVFRVKCTQCFIIYMATEIVASGSGVGEAGSSM